MVTQGRVAKWTSALSLSSLTRVSLQNTHGCITKSFQCRWAMLTFNHGYVEAHDRLMDRSFVHQNFDVRWVSNHNVFFFAQVGRWKSEVLSASLSWRDWVLLTVVVTVVFRISIFWIICNKVTSIVVGGLMHDKSAQNSADLSHV